MQLKRGNPKAFDTLKIGIRQLRGLEGKVGWFETARYPDGTPVAFVMALNELGHGNMPPRPTMRPTAINKREEWQQLAAQGSRSVIKGTMTAENLMEILTAKAEADIVEAIANLHEPALSPVTIELRAMKKRNPNLKITKATVGEAARKVAKAGYQAPTGVSVKPLVDTGLAVSTLTHIVSRK